MSKIEVNQISSQCGSTLTIGQSGDTVTLACGATQSGFGRTGTVDWNTTAITADPANAVSGTGYFANTTSAAFTITLPTSPSAGDIVAVRDYAQTFATNNLTIGRNGQPIDGQTFDLVLDTNGAAVTLVYVDGTQGWKSVNSNETVNQELFVAATGGTVTCCGDYKIHTFTGPGTFTVTCAGNAGGSNSVDYLVIAGGGSGGTSCSPRAGGGGAGGYRFSNGTASGCYTAGPAPLGASALPVTATGYPITVGGGGAAQTAGDNLGNSGSNSVFSTITSTGGGGGGGGSRTVGDFRLDGQPGGSGGGGGGASDASPTNPFNGGPGGTGNTPPVSPPQGNNGGHGTHNPGAWAAGGGGAGAGAAGGDASPATTPTPTANAGAGGNGLTSCITASPVTRTGGGGATGVGVPATSGGSGGGGAGNNSAAGTAGTTNTGSGGGAGPNVSGSGAGGSGIVIIRYKYQ